MAGKNSFCRTKIILLEFLPYKKYNRRKSQKIENVATVLDRGRAKLVNCKDQRLGLRLTKFELEKISRVATKKFK